MRTTIPASFPGYEECSKIPGAYVDAYTDLKLDPENPTGIILDTTWGEVHLDLKSIVKAGETVTHLELAPEENPTVIRYKNEAGDYECITGDELSRIVSLHLLKDVDQATAPEDGDVYMYNGTTNLFEPYDLKSVVGGLNTTINRLVSRITTLENKVSDLEGLIYNYPQDKTTKIPRANINLISDPTNNNDRSYGIFSHDTSTDQFADEYFA